MNSGRKATCLNRNHSICKLLILLICCCSGAESSFAKRFHYRECAGSENGISHIENEEETAYTKLKSLYSKDVESMGKCTVIHGNLEIVDVHQIDHTKDGFDYTFDFLDQVREITGYLLIWNVEVKEVRLPNLAIIRGNTLMTHHRPGQADESWAVRVKSFQGTTKNERGLEILSLPSLREITRGGVSFENNPFLCYIHLVNFRDLLQVNDLFPVDVKREGNGDAPNCTQLEEMDKLRCGVGEAIGSSTTAMPFNFSTSPEVLTTSADPVCVYGHCWGPKSEDCQTLTRVVCSPKCTKRKMLSNGTVVSYGTTRCFGPGDSECCDEDCAAGCWGDFRSECYACRVLEDSGECVNMCPGVRYDPNFQENLFSDQPKYAYHYRCVETCPAGTLVDDKSCVEQCGPQKRAEGKECVPCEGGHCTKTCKMPQRIDDPNIKGPFKKQMYDKTLEEALTNCTKISGDVLLDSVFFNGDNFTGLKPFNMTNLHLFKDVKEITGFLHVVNSPLKNLSFLSNLELVSGHGVTGGKMGSLTIADNKNMTFLGLASLKRVDRIPGNTIYVAGNSDMCYVNLDMIRNLIYPVPDRENFSPQSVSNNKNPSACAATREPCDEECTQVNGMDACWGPGPDMCFKCRNSELNNVTCVRKCDPSNTFMLPASSDDPVQKCQSCDPECKGGCTGPGPDKCKACRNYEDDRGVCLSKCPMSTFPDLQLRKCYSCPPVCEADRGCSGNMSKLGPGGCNRCEYTVMIHSENNRYQIHSLEWASNNTCEMTVEDKEELENPAEHQHHCPEDYYFDRIGYNDYSAISGSRLCIRCHSLCADGCWGSGPSKCNSCKFFSEGGVCTESCPHMSAVLEDVKRCVPCHEQCSNAGCTGEQAWQCNSCKYKYINRPITEENNSTELSNSTVLKLCVRNCPEELPYLRRDDAECVSECEPNEYVSPNQMCKQCHSECVGGCTGDLRSDCFACKHFQFESSCFEKCPDNTIISPKNKSLCMFRSIGAAALSKVVNSKPALVVLILGLLLCVAFIFCGFFYCWRAKKNTAIAEKLHREQKYLGMDILPKEEPIPNTPTGIEPSKGKMYIVQKHELKRIGPLGSGAFGTVYKGVWCPENDSKVQLPVAIKVLLDPVPGAEQTFIDEAQFMASVTHPCLLRLLAICITETPQLVTKLMPHGNLLDYIRKYGHALPSRTFFLWGKQIAEGMEYLQSKRIVHRDLAARNVLVQSTRQIKITDFGLAQMLKHGEDSVKFQGGKVPLKWLALESLIEKTFTHASDVWSMGVTLWEIFTLGGRPYAEISGGVSEMIKVLQDGERLPQPPGATLDLFVVMLKCWLVEPKSRLTFTQIKNEMTRMYDDADRFFEVQVEHLGKVDSPRDDQEFLKEFLLEQNDDGSSMERPYSKDSIDFNRTFMDPDDYLGLNSSHGHNTLGSNNRSFNLPPSLKSQNSGSGGTIEDNCYVNSPTSSTASTVVTQRQNSRSKPFVPPPKLPFHPTGNSPHTPHYPNTSDPAHYQPGASAPILYNNGMSRYPGQGGAGNTAPVLQSQHSATNTSGCSRGSDSENVFSYEHVPDHRFRQGPDGSCYSQIFPENQAVASKQPDYYNSPGAEDPRYSRSYSNNPYGPVVPPQLKLKSTNQPNNLTLTPTQNWQSLANSNYSPATDSSNPPTPINLNNNKSSPPLAGYSSVNAQRSKPHPNLMSGNKSKNNSRNYQTMDNNRDTSYA